VQRVRDRRTLGAEKKVQAIWGDEGDDTTPESDE